jgi:hypothetical protein
MNHTHTLSSIFFNDGPPVVLAKDSHHSTMALRPEGHGDSQGGLPDERSIQFHHIYVPNGLRLPFFALLCPHYRHIFVYPFFNSMPGRGSVSTVEERRQCITIVYDDLFWSREHRSSMTMCMPSIDQLLRWGSRVLTVSFPSPAQPLNLCMIYEEKNPLRFPLLCGFFHFFVHPSGPRLAAPRWVKVS